MAKKPKYKKIRVDFLIEISLPDELLKQMDYKDKRYLENLNRLDMRWKAGDKTSYVFHLGDIYKVNNVLTKYNYTLVYPERTELRRYGLTHSGQSLDIEKNGNDFVINQRFPDGRIETHIIPQKRVWRVYYTIKRYFEKHPEVEKVESPVIWEEICKEFGLDQYIGKYGKFFKDTFFGSRRTYHEFAYYPMKILDHIGKIRYENKWVYNIFKDD